METNITGVILFKTTPNRSNGASKLRNKMFFMNFMFKIEISEKVIYLSFNLLLKCCKFESNFNPEKKNTE